MIRAAHMLLCTAINAHGLRRPMHIIQPKPSAALPNAPVHVPRLFLLFTRLWHALFAQLGLVLLWRIWCNLTVSHPRPVRFVLLAMPRSGSTALVHALNGHPQVACAGEILNPLYRVYGDVSRRSHHWRCAVHADAILAGLAACLALRSLAGRGGTRDDGNYTPEEAVLGGDSASAVGFKVLDEQLDLRSDGTSLCGLCEECGRLSGDPPPLVVLLARRDLGRAYASRQRAHLTGVWYDDSRASARAAEAVAAVAEEEVEAGDEQEGDEEGDEEGVSGEENLLEDEELEEALRYAESTRAFWRAVEVDLLQRRCRTLRLYYEDFATSPESVLRRLTAFLGMPSLPPRVLGTMLHHASQSAPSRGSNSMAAAGRIATIATQPQRARMQFRFLKQENSAWWRASE